MNVTSPKPLNFPVSLSWKAHEIARNLALKSPNSEKYQQVYLNSLAIYAVDCYLNSLGFHSNWEKSDSYDPLLLSFFDVADLAVEQIGKLECLPILPQNSTCEVSPDAWENRLAYLVVELSEYRFLPTDSSLKKEEYQSGFFQDLNQAKIIGFTCENMEEKEGIIALMELQTLDNLPYYLQKHQQVQDSSSTHLRQWLNDQFQGGWLNIQQLLAIPSSCPDWRGKTRVEQYLNSQNLQPAFRSSSPQDVSEMLGIKPISLITKFGKYDFDLILKIQGKGNPLETESRYRIDIQAQSYEGENLPQGLKMTVIDKHQDTFLESSSGNDATILKIQPFSGQPNEQFTLNIRVGEECFREIFVV